MITEVIFGMVFVFVSQEENLRDMAKANDALSNLFPSIYLLQMEILIPTTKIITNLK